MLKVKGWKIFGFGWSSAVGGKTGNTLVLPEFSKKERSGNSGGGSRRAVLLWWSYLAQGLCAAPVAPLGWIPKLKLIFFLNSSLLSILLAILFGIFLKKALTTCFCPLVRLYLFFLALIEICPGNPICNGHGFCPEGRKICVCLHGFTGYGCENSPESMDEKVKALKERDGSNLINKVSIIFKRKYTCFFKGRIAPLRRESNSYLQKKLSSYFFKQLISKQIQFVKPFMNFHHQNYPKSHKTLI